MRILLVTPMPPDREARGAMPVVFDAVLIGLEAAHDVTLVTPAGPDEAELAAGERLRRAGHDVHVVRRHLGPERWRRRARMAGTWARGREPWRTVWFREPSVQPALDRIVSERRFDVIAVEDNSMATYRFPEAVPRVLTEHEVRRPRPVDWHLGPPRAWPSAVFREADWARWPQYQRRVWNRFDALQVFTERDAHAAGAIAPELAGRIHVAPFGMELPVLRTGEPDAGTIAFIGNYTHPPNVDAARWLVDEILPRVREAAPDARLRLAGPAVPAGLARHRGPGVDVVGVVADADDFLSAAAVVAAPVRTGGGMRMKVLHAMALGKPVVTTSRGAEGLGNGGPLPLVVADDTDTAANAIVTLLADAERRRQLGRAARRFVEDEHSPAAVARRLERVYRSVVEGDRQADDR